MPRFRLVVGRCPPLSLPPSMPLVFPCQDLPQPCLLVPAMGRIFSDGDERGTKTKTKTMP
eukprot:scaffold1222_cov317-Pavlova_lutheri.AAC.15